VEYQNKIKRLHKSIPVLAPVIKEVNESVNASSDTGEDVELKVETQEQAPIEILTVADEMPKPAKSHKSVKITCSVF
jgi:hypothetical protein